MERLRNCVNYYGYRLVIHSFNICYYMISVYDNIYEYCRTDKNKLLIEKYTPKFLEINETCIDYIKFTFESQKYNLFLSDKNKAHVYVYANLTDLNKNNNYFLDVELKVYNDKNDEILNTNISDFIKRCFIKESYLPWIKSKYEFWTELLYENSIISKSVYKSILNNLETYRLVLKTISRNIEILENDNIIFYSKNDNEVITITPNTN